MRERLERILGILATIQTGVPTDVNAMATRFGVSRRMVFRDLAALSEAGAHSSLEQRKGLYTLMQSPIKPVEQITHAEAFNLLLMLRIASAYPTFSDTQTRASAIRKTRNLIPSDLLRDMDRLLECISERPIHANPRTTELFDNIFRATSRRHQLDLTTNDGTTRRLLPTGLALERNRWVLYAFSPKDRGSCTYTFAEIKDAKVRKEQFLDADIPNRRSDEEPSFS